MERCDVALIVVDADEGVTDQDISVAGYAHDRGCGAIFLLNKWDRVDNRDGNALKRMSEDLTEYLDNIDIRVRYMHSDVETLERIREALGHLDGLGGHGDDLAADRVHLGMVFESQDSVAQVPEARAAVAGHLA